MVSRPQRAQSPILAESEQPPVETLADYLHRTSLTRRVFLDAGDFGELRLLGLRRTQVENALRELERAGRIELVAHEGAVYIKLPLGGRP